MITDINSEDRLVQKTFAEHMHNRLSWDSVYAWNEEIFGPNRTLGRASEREVVLIRDLRAALAELNRDLPQQAREQVQQPLPRRPRPSAAAFGERSDLGVRKALFHNHHQQ